MLVRNVWLDLERMSFTEKAQELIGSNHVTCAKVMGFDACVQCRVISQMREDLQAFKDFLNKEIKNEGSRCAKLIDRKLGDISQALKVLDGEKR